MATLPKQTHQSAHESALALYDTLAAQTDPHIKKALSTLDSALRLYTPANLAVAFNGGKDATVVLYLSLAALANRTRARPSGTAALTCLYLVGPAEASFAEVDAFVADVARATPQIDCVHERAGTRDGIARFVARRADSCAFVMGTRRADPHGADMEHFEPSSPGWAPFMRVNPILDWRYGDVWRFLRDNGIPFCDMYERGYTSIGSTATTVPNPALKVVDGDCVRYKPAWMLEDESLERAGRIKKGS